MESESYRIKLVADFNARNLAALLEKNAFNSGVKCTQAPYGQTLQLLLARSDEFWNDPCDALVLWTLPQLVTPEFQKVLSSEEFSTANLMAEVDSFCAFVKHIPDNVRAILFPSWIAPEEERGLGPLNLANQIGIANALMRMNLRLADQFEKDSRVILLDSQSWLATSGLGAYSPKLWYMSKTPFQNTVFQEASKDILSALDGLRGRNKKVLVLDLDNTLWGGIVGEVGWEKLRLGGHDPIGEAFVDFQQRLKRLVNRGVLLAISSKNEEAVVLEAICRHPEMALRLEDFAAWKINWNDKAQNITELMATLNLGLDSAVFLDDSPVERSRVREALPQVTVPDLPEDPMQYPSFLGKLRYFDNPMVSKEDRNRSGMYAADRQRTALKATVKSLQDWLQMLDLRVDVEPLCNSNLERAAQLFNKTNQMNLSTRRMMPSELSSWSGVAGHDLCVFRVTDKFGDYGLCGISSLAREGSRGRLVDFLLSCRVMGRGVEETMLIASARRARELGYTELYAEFLPTPKNQPCERWLQSQSLLAREKNVYRLTLQNGLEFPSHVKVTLPEK
jgi:FkbH-like protein